MANKDQEQAISTEIMNKCIEFAKEEKWEAAINLFENDDNSEHLYYKSLLAVLHFERHRKEIPCFSWLRALDSINKAIYMKDDPKYYFLKSIMCYNLSLYPDTLSPEKRGLVQRLLDSLDGSTAISHCFTKDYNYNHIHPRNNCSTAPLDDSDTKLLEAFTDVKSRSTAQKEEWQQQALDSIEIAMHLDESNVDYRLLKAKIFLSMRQYESAKELLETTLASNPDRNDIILDLINVLEKMDIGKEAISTINEALQYKPSDMILIEKKLKLLIKHEMNDELDVYRNVLLQNSDLSFDVYLTLITASIELNDVLSAIDILNTAILVDFVPEEYFSIVVRECVVKNIYFEAKKIIPLAKRNFYRYNYDQDYANDSLEELYYIIYDYLIREEEYQEALYVAEIASNDGLIRFDTERILPLVYLGRLKDAITIIQQPDIPDIMVIVGIISELWENALYHEVYMLCEEICDQTEYLFYWYSLWACVALGLDKKASEYLSKLSINGLFEQLSNPERKENKFHIKELLQMKLPFHKMQTELFLTMLSMLYDGYKNLSEIEQDFYLLHDRISSNELTIDPAFTNDASFIDLKTRIELLNEYMHESVMLPSDFLHFVFKLLFAANNSIQQVVLGKIEEARSLERNRILANLSHSIKNMLKAVLGPLQTLREELPEKAGIIDNAIKGANLIREIVNAINLSFNTSMDELNWDVLKPGKDSMSLQDMIADSLKYSIGNMFDFRYFPVYAENYFPRSLGKADFEGITSEWNQAQSSIDMVKDFCDRHLFKLALNLDDSRDYHVGNEKSSAIKLMILFQEMIFNAVKYTSFIPLEERTVQISLTRHDEKLRLMVRNSYSEKVRAKTTGVGKLVIENFAKVLGCEPKTNAENNSYSIEMEFADIWRKHAQDSLR